MGKLKGFTRAIRNIVTGGRNAERIMQDGSYAATLVKERIKASLLRVVKSFALTFIICALIIVFIISAVSLVFDIFFESAFNNIEYVSQIDPREMQEWSDSLSDTDIEDMQSYGASVHPDKIHRYVEIEDESYLKNVSINIPERTVRWSSKDPVKVSNTVYINHEFPLGDTAYPYRQWWHSTLGLDAINDSANDKHNMGIVNSAREELKPIFNWVDPMYEKYEHGLEYNRNSLAPSSMEEEITNTTITTVKITGGGKSETITYYTEVSSWRPLPVLNDVETMFAMDSFNYEATTDKQTSYAEPQVSHYTKTSTKMVDGKEVEEETSYTRTSNTTYITEINSWQLRDISKIYNTKFLDFLDMNDIDTKDDPVVMLEMVKTLPQNYDFIAQYGDYLSNMDFTGLGIGGHYANFSGAYFAWPTPSSSRITSYYGYRIHPIFKTKKMHTGIDIGAAQGKDIIASADGTVSLAGWQGGYGNTVKINHGGGIETLYAHNSALLVKAGQVVRQGDVIAKVGSTGNSTGPHLHFEIRKNGNHVDPLPWLNNSVSPANTSMKTYMDYRKITNKSSKQYKLQQKNGVYTDKEGFRKIGNKFMIAIGTGFGAGVGDEVTVRLSNGGVFNAIVGDIKSNAHTDSKNIQHSVDGSVVEFIVDTNSLDRTIKGMGDCSYSKLNNFKGNVVSIKIN